MMNGNYIVHLYWGMFWVLFFRVPLHLVVDRSRIADSPGSVAKPLRMKKHDW